jgi:hypothetical protein
MITILLSLRFLMLSKIIEFFKSPKWSWSAFLICPIWSIYYHIWLGIVPLIPIILLSSMALLSIQGYPVNSFLKYLGLRNIYKFVVCIYALTSILIGFYGNKLVISKGGYLKSADFEGNQLMWNIIAFLICMPVNFFFLYGSYELTNLIIENK